MSQTITDTYNRKYENETWKPFLLRPNAISTNRYDDIARLLFCESGERLLEVGCGAGQLLIALAESGVKFNKFTGFDLSDVRIGKAQKALENHPNLVGRINFSVGNADASLPYENDSFDTVICCAVLEHVVDIFGLMREMGRICRFGGSLLLTVPNLCYIKHIRDLCTGRLPLTGIDTRDMASWEHEGWDGGHLHYFSPSSLAALLKHTGFQAEKWTSDGRLAKFRRYFRPLCGNLTVRARRISSSPPRTITLGPGPN